VADRPEEHADLGATELLDAHLLDVVLPLQPGEQLASRCLAQIPTGGADHDQLRPGLPAIDSMTWALGVGSVEARDEHDTPAATDLATHSKAHWRRACLGERGEHAERPPDRPGWAWTAWTMTSSGVPGRIGTRRVLPILASPDTRRSPRCWRRLGDSAN
jgi:hypothetical protein